MKEIPLTQGKVALVDDEDYPKLSVYKWHATPSRSGDVAYAASWSASGCKKLVLMHRIILGTPPGMDTDHINGDGLDNRRENLRITTHRKNGQNMHISKSSRFPGVNLDKMTGKWRSQIQVRGKRHTLGRFSNELEAATVYRVACAVLVGE